MFNGKFHYKLSFSIAMLNYQLGLAKKMPILWYFHGENSGIELDFLPD